MTPYHGVLRCRSSILTPASPYRIVALELAPQPGMEGRGLIERAYSSDLFAHHMVPGRAAHKRVGDKARK